MTLRPWIAAALALAACGKKSDGKRAADADRPVAAADAAAAPAAPPDAAAAVTANPDAEPTVPAPPPVVVVTKVGDCKTEYAPKPSRDPNPVCKIAGGTFTMGYGGKDAAAFDGPVQEVKVAAYAIDQLEVTNAQVAHFLNATRANACANDAPCFPPAAWVKPNGNRVRTPSQIEEDAGAYRVKPGSERLPFVLATREGAARYCAWAGKRLPTGAEWELAARLDPARGKARVYPWGDRFEPKRANCAETDCQDGFEQYAPVGSFPGGASATGVLDLAGNVAEHTADCHGGEPAGTPGCDPSTRPSAFSSDRASLRPSNHQRLEAAGFRCAM